MFLRFQQSSLSYRAECRDELPSVGLSVCTLHCCEQVAPNPSCIHCFVSLSNLMILCLACGPRQMVLVHLAIAGVVLWRGEVPKGNRLEICLIVVQSSEPRPRHCLPCGPSLVTSSLVIHSSSSRPGVQLAPPSTPWTFSSWASNVVPRMFRCNMGRQRYLSRNAR
jgi:hypothetical protein